MLSESCASPRCELKILRRKSRLSFKKTEDGCFPITLELVEAPRKWTQELRLDKNSSKNHKLLWCRTFCNFNSIVCWHSSIVCMTIVCMTLTWRDQVGYKSTKKSMPIHAVFDNDHKTYFLAQTYILKRSLVTRINTEIVWNQQVQPKTPIITTSPKSKKSCYNDY